VGESLAASYERCRELHRRQGRTYYLATRLLPAWKRRHVHALYGFTRYTDEIVDSLDGTPPDLRAGRLHDWSARFLNGLCGASIEDPILPAVLHTIEVFDLDRADFEVFLRSMAMDLTIGSYQTYDDLLRYTEGSAAVIGTMMLPILESSDPAAAREPSRQLGLAFQLTNFIRDVGEDLQRDRIYLPLDDLMRFEVSVADLRSAARSGSSCERIRALVEFEVRRAQEHYARAAPGIGLLRPASQACVRTAYRLYGGILDEVARAGYDVFARRAAVPSRRRITVAARCLLTRPGRPVPLPGVSRATFPSQQACNEHV
jgi:phytoene synthase